MSLPVHGVRDRSATSLADLPGPTECAYEAPTCTLEPSEPPGGGVMDALRARGLRFCREADSVVEGFLCDEPTVVSNACRKPGNAFDAYVCDEPRMRALQTSVLRETFSFLKSLLFMFLRR